MAYYSCFFPFLNAHDSKATFLPRETNILLNNLSSRFHPWKSKPKESFKSAFYVFVDTWQENKQAEIVYLYVEENGLFHKLTLAMILSTKGLKSPFLNLVVINGTLRYLIKSELMVKPIHSTSLLWKIVVLDEKKMLDFMSLALKSD